jgi:hypothetical protein
MSEIYSAREERIKKHLDRVFGNSPQAAELKSIALKAQLDKLTDDDARKYWEEKQRDLEEIKRLMPEVNELALPQPSITITNQPLLSNTILGEPPQYIVNGTITVSGQGEVDRCEDTAIKHEVVSGNTVKWEYEISDSV